MALDREYRDLVLLGIKYESAVLAGLDDARLSVIAGQLREEVGDDWENEPGILHGRNAARQEHGLENLAEAKNGTNPPEAPVRRSLLRRWLKS